MPLNRSLFRNFTWLAASQGANFVIPLIVYPYLLRIIGIEKFGLVVFAQAVVMFFVMVTDFGFSITAVREVSLHRNEPDKLSTVFSRLYTTKFLLLGITFTIFFLLVSLIPEWQEEQLLFLSSFTIVASQMLLPLWFFHGFEKMNGVAIMNMISKVLFVMLILLMINNDGDYLWVNFYLGSTQMLVGLIAVVFIMMKYRIRFVVPSVSTIVVQINHNRSLFVSVLANFASSNSNIIILGLMTNPVATGYYGIVEKILLAIKAPAVLLYQSVFSQVCRMAEESFSRLFKYLKSLVRLIFIGFIPLGIAVFFLAEELVHLFSGQYLEEPVLLLKIVSFVPLMAALNIPASQTLLAYNFRKSYAVVAIGGALVNIALNVILISAFAAHGAAITALATEVLITTALYFNMSIQHKQYSVAGVFNIVK